MMKNLKHGSISRVIVGIVKILQEPTYECLGLKAGSELVTDQFELDFLKYYEESGLHDKTKALHKARQEFDLIKMGVGEDDEPEFWDCPVEGLTRLENTNFHDGQMRFTR